MNTGTIIMLAICVILILLPPKYDPAIRLKEWLQDRRIGR